MGCAHPNEQTWKEVAGLFLFAKCQPPAVPGPEESHEVLRRLKQAHASERTRIGLPQNLPFYKDFPGAATFFASHPAEFALAFGPGELRNTFKLYTTVRNNLPHMIIYIHMYLSAVYTHLDR